MACENAPFGSSVGNFSQLKVGVENADQPSSRLIVDRFTSATHSQIPQNIFFLPLIRNDPNSKSVYAVGMKTLVPLMLLNNLFD